MKTYIIPFLTIAVLILNTSEALTQATEPYKFDRDFSPLSPDYTLHGYFSSYKTPSHTLGQGRIPYRTMSGKWGYCNEQKQIVIAPEYDEVECFPAVGCAIVKKDGKWGLIDSSGNVVRPCKYTWISRSDNGIRVNIGGGFNWNDNLDGIRVNIGGYLNWGENVEGGEWGFLSIMGKEILPLRYTGIYESYGKDTKELYAKSGDLAHIYNLDGKEMIAPKYRDIYPLRYDTYIFITKDNRWKKFVPRVLISGSSVFSPDDRDLYPVKHNTYTRHNAYVVITKDRKWGFLNRTLGKAFALREFRRGDGCSDHNSLIISKIGTFGNKIWVGRCNSFSRWGTQFSLLDSIGREIIPPRYVGIENLSDECAAVENNYGWGLVDQTGKEVISPKYDRIKSTDNKNLFCIEVGRKYGVVNTKGKEILSPRYDWIEIYDGYIVMRDEQKSGLVDSTGKEIVPPYYETILRYSEGFMGVQLHDKYGFIDRTGREIIPPHYDAVSKFSEGYASVQSNGKYGFVDTTGKEVVPLRYDKVRDFTSGYALVMLNSKYGFIDHSGREVIPPYYDDIEGFSEGFSAVMLDNKWGFIDSTGREVIPPCYDDVGYFFQGYAIVQMGNKYGFIDRTGKELIPPRYDCISRIVNGYVRVMKKPTFTEYILQGYVGIDGTEYWEGGYTAPKK